MNMGDLKLAINVGTVQVAILVQASGVVGAGDRVVLNSEVGVGKLKIMERKNKTNPIGRQYINRLFWPFGTNNALRGQSYWCLLVFTLILSLLRHTFLNSCLVYELTNLLY